MPSAMARKPKDGSKSVPRRTFAAIGLCWTAIMLLFAISANRWVKDETVQLALTQARSFFRMIVDMRTWCASHGGVYAPVTPDTQPNPYLDVPNRDIALDDGRTLTLINPAFMTRQLSMITSKQNDIRFHITSRNPIRPGNRPDPWERNALQTFEKKDAEYSEWILPESGPNELRYMAPLWTQESCLPCHAKQGYRAGELRGGIRVSIPADAFLEARDRTLRKLHGVFFTLWFLGAVGIYFSYRETVADAAKREQLIERLQSALREIRTLKGILPICSSCKKIRKDSGSWEQVEKYISEHSDALFSHGICPECAKKLYPDFADKI